MTRSVLGLAVIFVSAVAFAAPALAASEDCPRGDLDSRYCDRDGDLVADLPRDKEQWIDPETILFTYTPVEDPAVYAKIWDGFIRHMAKVTGRKVKYVRVQSYAAELAALRSGRLHVAGVNTGGNPAAVNCAGFVPFAIMGAADGSFGYEMEIIVPNDSRIRTPADLKGRTLTFTAKTSNSGFKAPTALLLSEFGLQAEKDYRVAFSGKHDTSVLGVANRDYEAAAVANEVMKRMIARKAVDPAKIRSIYKSQTFPTTGYGHVYNLHPDLAAKVRYAFFTFSWKGSALQKEFRGEDRFITINYKRDWAVVRKIDAASGVRYSCL